MLVLWVSLELREQRGMYEATRVGSLNGGSAREVWGLAGNPVVLGTTRKIEPRHVVRV